MGKNKAEKGQEELFPTFNKILGKGAVPSFVKEKTKKPTRDDLSFRNEKTSYLTHDFHSYPAKFIPQLVTWLLQRYSNVNDWVLDPFLGSGTTFVEAILNDRSCYGVEINPLGRLVSLAKSTPISTKILLEERDHLLNEITKLLQKYFGSQSIFDLKKIDLPKFKLWHPDFENIEKWFLPEVVLELAIVRRSIESIKDKRVKNIALVAFSSIIKNVSNARVDERNPKLRKVIREKPDTTKIFKNRFDKMMKDVINYSTLVKGKKNKIKIIGNDARKLKLKNNSVDLIITSPPYAYAIDYIRMHKLSLYWLGENELISLDREFVGTERVYSEEYNADYKFNLKDIDESIREVAIKNKKKGYVLFRYFFDMRKCLEEMYRVLKNGSIAAIVIGDSNVQNVLIPTHIYLNQISEELGFKIKDVLLREVPSEKKGLTNVHGNYGGEMVSVEYINILEK